MMNDVRNRMEVPGPTRKNLREMIKDEQKITQQLYLASARRVLDKHYGWPEDEINVFQAYLQDEVNFRG